MATEEKRPPPRARVRRGTVGVAVYDANCLFSKHVRYVLLGFAVHGVVRARWSRRLLEETAGSLARNLRGDSLEDLGRWIKRETDLVQGGLVEGYQKWADTVSLPDLGDVHVVAAAIESGATTIVTANLKDFPSGELDRHSIVAQDPDSFLLRCIAASPVVAEHLISEHPDPHRLLELLQRELPRSAARLRALVS